MRLIRWAGLASVLCLSAGPASGAVGDHVWSKGFATGGGAAVSGTGHVALGGIFFGSVDFGGGSLTSSNMFGGDLYLARFDQTGAHIWSQQFTPGGFGASLDACASDPAGNIFVAGTIQGNGTVNFGGGTLSGSGQLFLAAFSPAGAHLWSKTIGTGFVQGMAASTTHLYATGYTYGTMDFGGGPLTSAGSADVFLGATTTAGAHAWATLFGDASDQAGLGIAVDGTGSVLLASGLIGTTNFGGGPLVASAARDVGLAKFSSAGAHVWSRIIAGTFSPGGGPLRSLAVAGGPSGQAALVGEHSGTVNFGGGPRTASGSFDSFVATYDAAGNHQWSATRGGASHDGASGAAYDASGNLFVSGGFLSASASFGGSAFAHSGGFGQDFFAAAYDPAGAHLWSSPFSGTAQYLIRSSVFPTGDMLLWGGGGGGIDFGGGPLASADVFMARLGGQSTASVWERTSRGALDLGPASPNPFLSSTRLTFSIPSTGPVRLDIHDLAGRRVATLIDATLSPGRHHIEWSGRTADGNLAPSGVYHVRLKAHGAVRATRVVRMR